MAEMSSKDRFFDDLAAQLVALMEQGDAVWQRGWSAVSLTQRNGQSDKAYSGCNQLRLMLTAIQSGYRDNRWVTFNQAKTLGGNVNKGEHGMTVLTPMYYDRETGKPFSEKTLEGMTREEQKQYIDAHVTVRFGTATVFNAEQCSGLKLKPLEENQTPTTGDRNGEIDALLENCPVPVLENGGNRAFYSPSDDTVHLPPFTAFRSTEEYYSTVLHELAHSTGHEKRLNRLGGNGDEAYAREELIAEFASVFLQSKYGQTVAGAHIENHAAYLRSWASALREDKNYLPEVLTAAKKATDFVTKYYANGRDVADETSAEEKTQEKSADKPVVFDTDSVFAEQVDAVLSGADTTSTHLRIMQTPKILRDVGFPNLPVLMTAKHLRTITAESGKAGSNYHGLDLKTVKKLPEQLGDPVMIFDSLTRDDSVVMLTEMLDSARRPVIAAVMIEGKGNVDGYKISANIMTSAYGKDNFKAFLHNNLAADTVLYWDKERSENLCATLGIELPTALSALEDGKVLRKSKATTLWEQKKLGKAEHKGESQTTEIPEVQFLDSQQSLDSTVSIHQNDAFVNPEIEKSAKIDKKSDEKEKSQGNLEVPGVQFPDKIKPLDSGRDSTQSVNLGVQFPDVMPASDSTDSIHQKAVFVNPEIEKSTEIEEKTQEKSADVIKLHMTEAEAAVFRDFVAGRNDAMQGAKMIYDFGIDRPQSEDFWRGLAYLGEVEQTETGYGVSYDRMRQHDFSINTAKADDPVNTGENDVLQTGWENMRGTAENGVEGQATPSTSELDRIVQAQMSGNAENGAKIEQNEAFLVELPPMGKTKAQQRADIAKNAPPSLRRLKNWSAWFTVTGKDADGKPKVKKCNVQAHDGAKAHYGDKSSWAKVNDPTTWTDFDTASAYAAKKNCGGLTIALDSRSGITCIDLDHCIDENGKLNGVAQDVLRLLPQTYVERSVSGSGLHVFLKGDVLENGTFGNRVETERGEIEVYADRKFMSMTGNVLPAYTFDVAECPDALKKYLRQTLPKKSVVHTPRPSTSSSKTDAEVEARILNSKKADEYRRLMTGESLTGDHSRDDMKLMNIMGFFANGDVEQVMRMFSHSGLYRPEKGEAYLRHTAEKTCQTLFSRAEDYRPQFGSGRGRGESRGGDRAR